MLALTRRMSESIRIGDDIIVRVLSIKGNQVRLGVEAPKTVEVHRKEDYGRVKQMEEADREE